MTKAFISLQELRRKIYTKREDRQAMEVLGAVLSDLQEGGCPARSLSIGERANDGAPWNRWQKGL